MGSHDFIYQCCVHLQRHPMISSISVVSIYVEGQAKAETFWCDTIGFEVVRKAPFEGYFWIQVAPHKDAEEMGQTTLSLFPRALDKEWKKKKKKKKKVPRVYPPS